MVRKNNGGEAPYKTHRLQGIKHIFRNKSVTKDQLDPANPSLTASPPGRAGQGGRPGPSTGIPAIFDDPDNREKILDIIDDYMDLVDAIAGSRKDEKV